jgi:hypothetical protein
MNKTIAISAGSLAGLIAGLSLGLIKEIED